MLVTRARGVEGDARGITMAHKGRQVSLMEAESWNAAMADLGFSPHDSLPWSARRVNMLVEGIRLPREAGRVLAIGNGLRIETTKECNPCFRMDEIHDGLQSALRPDWRGGVLGTVISDGEIAVGDPIRIEE